MLALITGGTGFVGRHLVRHLEESGTRTISLTSNPAERSGAEASRLLDIRDADALETIVGQLQPQQVYHLAAVTSISAAASDERTAFDVNVWGTRNVLAAASSFKPAPKVLNVSTSQVYGESINRQITENEASNPRNTYAATKAAAEVLARRYATQCDIVTARPFNHSGPGQSPGFVLPFFAHEIAAIELGQRTPVIRTGDLNVRRDFTDVRDVVRAYVLLLEKGIAGHTYNICSGKACLLSDALDYLLSLSSAQITIERDPAKVRNGEASAIFGSYDKISHDTGWQPTISFEQMLHDILHYWDRLFPRNSPPRLPADSLPSLCYCLS